jgi:hypothetical protein
MPKRVKQPDDPAALPRPPKAFREYMRLIGQKGGRASGARRMTNLTPKQRSTIARTAARARWNAAKARPEEP